MHGFEQGDLIVRPNYLFVGSLGLLVAMILVGFLHVSGNPSRELPVIPPPTDLKTRLPLLGKLLEWRPLQFVSTMPVLAGLILMGLLTAVQLVAVIKPRGEWTIETVYGGDPSSTDPKAYFAFNQGYAWADTFFWAPIQIAGSIHRTARSHLAVFNSSWR